MIEFVVVKVSIDADDNFSSLFSFYICICIWIFLVHSVQQSLTVPSHLAWHFTIWHSCTALHCTTFHSTALHCTALHCTALHCISQKCTALHCISQHLNISLKLYSSVLFCNLIYCTTLCCILLKVYRLSLWRNVQRPVERWLAA